MNNNKEVGSSSLSWSSPSERWYAFHTQTSDGWRARVVTVTDKAFPKNQNMKKRRMANNDAQEYRDKIGGISEPSVLNENSHEPARQSHQPARHATRR